jgi:hypothetical protein
LRRLAGVSVNIHRLIAPRSRLGCAPRDPSPS